MPWPTPGAQQDDVLILGAGLAGLAAGHALAAAGRRVKVLERAPEVGGLSRTVVAGDFRFDLGGHRFFTRDPRVQAIVDEVAGDECVVVPRRSQILLRGRYIDYPLSPANALSGLGLLRSIRIVLDHARERLKARLRPGELVSLEDWVVRHFGRTLFELYFEEYSEKVWGIPCGLISMSWVAQRIDGLSLGAAVRNAFFRRAGDARTLADRFTYPARGIGRIAEGLADEIRRENEVRCGVEVRRLRREGRRVRGAVVREGGRESAVDADAFVSTVPLPELVRMLDPAPPADVLAAAARLGFRDLVVVAVMLDRPRATSQSWLYFPERHIPFGRIHEPTNWSEAMAPAGKTLLVAEQFCFRGDETWRAPDEQLVEGTVRALDELGIASRAEVLGAEVRRVARAYPLFDVGHEAHRATLRAWVGQLENLFVAGRGGTFSYHNMDHAMASGLEAADRVLAAEVGRPAARARRLA
jgi:protoporphyrinogen oxidase